MARTTATELAGLLGVDVIGFAIMSNHFHLVLRSRPGWSRCGAG
ncbi:hypothetical protein [Pirellulimonas nuda]|nr:hypothetical protein [Pirellulimonas nuda]